MQACNVQHDVIYDLKVIDVAYDIIGFKMFLISQV
jgi:hypothetical protein